MNAFARALAALHRDANLGIACTWVPKAGTLEADGVACRGILSQPVQEGFGAGQLGAVSERLAIDIQVADVATIVRGDRVVIEGSSRKVEEADRDPEGLTWRLVLSKSV